MAKEFAPMKLEMSVIDTLGRYGDVFLDGHLLEHVQSVSLDMKAGECPIATIKMIVNPVIRGKGGEKC